MRLKLALALAAAAIAFAATAPAAHAAETLLTFDDIAAGTSVSTQYQSRGIVFGPSSTGAQTTRSAPRVTTVATTQAASGDRVGQVVRQCLAGFECVGTPETWAQFTSGSASRVSVSVGGFGTVTSTISLTAFRIDGTQLATTSAGVTGGAGFRTVLSVAPSGGGIAFVRIRGSSLASFGIDNLRAEIVAATPDFTLSAPGALRIAQGSNVGHGVIVNRTNFAGTIRLTADPATLPSGVTMTPVDTTSSTQTTVRPNFVASPTAALTTGRQIRIVGTPLNPPVGLKPRSTTVTADVFAIVDPRLTGVEVTQGIQTLSLPWTDTAIPTTKTYAGVPLQANGKTIVRVYANNARQFSPGTLANVSVQLFGSNAATGAPLAGSPRLPDQGPRSLAFGASGVVTDAERKATGSAFTFTLPASWTGTNPGSTSQQDLAINLRAQLVFTPSQTLVECGGGSCGTNNSQTLNATRFTATCCVNVATVDLRANGSAAPDPISSILRLADDVTPLELKIPAYQTQIDVSDELNGDVSPEVEDKRVLIADRMVEFMQKDTANDVVAGFGADGFPACGGQDLYAICDDDNRWSDGEERELTWQVHELHHALYREHASGNSTCGGGGDAWPPDEIGLIQGIALDRSIATPYRVFASADDVPATVGDADAGGVVDLMSYCIFNGLEENVWISVRGWNELMSRYARNARPAFVAPHTHAHAREIAPMGPRGQTAQAPAGLLVNAAVDPAGAVGVTGVSPGGVDDGRGAVESQYRLVVRDGAGAVLADVAMMAREAHFDGSPSGAVLTGLASLDAAQAARVEVVKDGAVLASRVRSPRAPTAAFTSPRRGRLVGRDRTLEIRWRAADADGDALSTVVEWSAQGGRPGTWRQVSIGPNGGRVALPSEYFAGSAEARLRLRVSDGFHETVVLSPPFRTVHRGPRVRIIEPVAGASVRRDATLLLRGEALDERSQTLPRRAVRWFDGRRLLGRGAQLGVDGLAAGRHRLRLEGVDGDGRRAGARVSVRVQPVAPLFLALESPQSAGTRAGRVTLRVASSLPARLRVTGAGVRTTRVAVGKRRRTVRVRHRAGDAPLVLRLALRADGRTTRAELVITRS